ncbi:Metallo-dependent phosphatase-like protein [Syncephalis fuscata]|nr:Metallo-dependent phosphatase-like protein [Syncephalis fuscata]
MFRLAIVADPQIIDAYSYHQSPGVGLALTEFYTDIYMIKSFYYLQKLHKPDAILFLGDLFDGGREWKDDTWYPELKRFQWIFRRKSEYTGKTLYLAGNHDFGFGDTVILSARSRYETVFGSPNWEMRLANHSIIALDTLSLSSRVPDIRNDAQQFLDQEAARANETLPRMLFTHVPLYRPNFQYCGPLRHMNKGLYQAKGYQYQNLVVENLSREILQKIQPSMVFAGDDHDQCRWIHQVGAKQSIEYTVGTFSWSMGNPFPSFGMLSLYNPLDNKNNSPKITSEYDVCFLPFQLGIYIGYGSFALISVTAIVLQLRYSRRRSLLKYTGGDKPAKLSSTIFFSILQIVITSVLFYLITLAIILHEHSN